MTNKDKFLKDGVTAEELWEKFQEYYYKNKSKESDVEKAFVNFFEQQVKPTLTDDERAILRNIMFFTKIGKDRTSIYVATKENSIYRLGVFNHLFQFIKERRRVRDKGVTKWTNFIKLI